MTPLSIPDHAMMDPQEAIARDVHDLRNLMEDVSRAAHHTITDAELLTRLATCATWSDKERCLEEAAWGLRKQWLALAHSSSDHTLKSPVFAHDTAWAADGSAVEFGYERDIDVSVLEERRFEYMPSYAGWSTDMVLFRSGQAALASLMHVAMATWGRSYPISVAHQGAYFETKSLLASLPVKISGREAPQPDVTILEPVWCDGQFGRPEITQAPRHALFLDITLSGPTFDVSPYLTGDISLVVAFSSGLKLDQAGLELANVGIVRIYARDKLQTVGAELRNVRVLTGTNLTFDELSALSAPWFLNRQHADNYTTAVFANNRALGNAIGNSSPVFLPNCHPSLIAPSLEGPFCALQLRDATRDRYKTLLELIETEIRKRDLAADRGGSFGFRGHRYDFIEPEPPTLPFLRVALGWRDGHSRNGLCQLFGEIGSRPF